MCVGVVLMKQVMSKKDCNLANSVNNGRRDLTPVPTQYDDKHFHLYLFICKELSCKQQYLQFKDDGSSIWYVKLLFLQLNFSIHQ